MLTAPPRTVIHRIRPLAAADIAPAVNWLSQLTLNQRYGFTGTAISGELRQAQAKGDWLQVAEADGQSVGFAWCEARASFGRPYLRLICVRAGWQNGGIGGALLRAAEAWAAAQNPPSSLTLLTTADNEAAHRFYRRAGYAEIGRLPHFAIADADEIIFHKPLPDGPGGWSHPR